jgi:Protein of unknown function (DUF3300)
MSAWSNWVGKFCFIAALAVPIALSGTSLPVLAQDQQGQQQPQQQPQSQMQPQQQPLTQQELAQLVAPIALYPDALLAQVLTASTYPLEVTLAARWAEKNPNLKGAALEEAMQKEPWDPSVKGLTSVPQVLAMMNEKLDWTQQLGETFLAQPDDVQNAIQALRAKADAAGNLKSSKEQRVRRVSATPSPGYVGPPEYIVIEPVEPDYIYVPVYDPVVVYGAGYWPPAYVPFFWYPRWWTVGPVIGFATAAAFVGPALWYSYNWGHSGYAAIQTNTALYSRFNRVNVTGGGQFQNWKFDPVHRGSVPFKNTNLQRQFGNVGARGVQGVQTGKGQIEQQRQQQMQQQQGQPQFQQQPRQQQMQQQQGQPQFQQQPRQQQMQQTQQQQGQPQLQREQRVQSIQQKRQTQVQHEQRVQVKPVRPPKQQQRQQQQPQPQLQQQQRQQQQRQQQTQQQQGQPQLQQQQRQQQMQQQQRQAPHQQPARRPPCGGPGQPPCR